MCSALRIDAAVYHYNAAGTPSKFVADTLPGTAWTNPAFNADFSVVVGDAGIYKYTVGTTTYASALTHTFLANKKVWTTGNKVLVASWASSGTANVNNYSVKAFVANAATYDVVGSIEGQYYEAVATNPPVFSVSTSLDKVAVYGSANATGFFARMKSFDYTAKTSV